MQVPPSVPSFDPKQAESSRAESPNSVRPVSGISLGWLAFALLLFLLLLATLRNAEPRSRLVPAVLVTLGFAVLARVLRGVTVSGAAAGFLVTSILFVAAGKTMFGAVLLVFVLTYLATRFGRSRKRSLAIAERPGGRDGAQVLANVGMAALAAALAWLTPWHLLALTAAIAALAEAASDTVSSEVGKAAGKTARLITSGQIVSAGTDGAISVPGTLAGIAAATIVGVEAWATGMLNPRFVAVASLSGILGMLCDSLLGATLENRGMLTNNAVNLLSTAFSFLAAMLLPTIL